MQQLIRKMVGGMANQATKFYRRLAFGLAAKWDHAYSTTISLPPCQTRKDVYIGGL